MKKLTFLGAALCVAMVFTGCKSKESAYKKAYEKAKAQETTIYGGNENNEEKMSVTPEVEPVTETPVYNNYENEPVRRENVSVVDGAGLKTFSVVVGSFGVKANADGLKQRLQNAGYQSQIAYNSERNMYRVIASTHDDKASAVQSRNQLRAQFPDAWLLFQ